MAYTVHFEKATVDYDFSRGPQALKVITEGKKPKIVRPKGPDGYVQELQYLVDAIQSGKAPTRVTAQDGLSAVEICEAEERSVRTRQFVPLAPAGKTV